MNKLDELNAMRKSAAALNTSDHEVTNRLEAVADRVSVMLMAIGESGSVGKLKATRNDLDWIAEKIQDTKVILDLMIRERELIGKLNEFDEAIKETGEAIPGWQSYGSGQMLFIEPELEELTDLDNTNIDPVTKERVKQQIEIQQLIDSVRASAENEEIKNKMDRLSSLTGVHGFKEIIIRKMTEPEVGPLVRRVKTWKP